jgi:hypothetical protein
MNEGEKERGRDGKREKERESERERERKKERERERKKEIEKGWLSWYFHFSSASKSHFSPSCHHPFLKAAF